MTRACLLLLAVLTLGCSSTMPADPEDHCIESQFWQCRRDQAGGRISDAQYDECLVPIRSTCMSAAWPPGCSPAQSESDACIELLSSTDGVGLTTEQLLAMFDECMLCP